MQNSKHETHHAPITGIPEACPARDCTDRGDPLAREFPTFDVANPNYLVTGSGYGSEFLSKAALKLAQPYLSVGNEFLAVVKWARTVAEERDSRLFRPDGSVAPSEDTQQRAAFKLPITQAEYKPTTPVIPMSVYGLGRAASDAAASNFMTDAMDKGPLVGALGVGLPGAALGLAGGSIYNWFADEDEKIPAWAAPLAGAILGGATGMYGGNFRQAVPGINAGAGLEPKASVGSSKSASTWRDDSSFKEDPYVVIAQALAQSGLDPAQRMQAQAAIPQLSSDDADALAKLLKTAFGASLGAIIVRFLKGRGLMKALGGAFLGGLISNFF